MKKIWKEIVFDIRKNFFLFFIMTIQLTVYFVVGLFSDQLEKEIISQTNNIMYNQQKLEYYDLTDNLVGQYEDAFFSNKDALGKLKIMYSQLIDNESFEYLEMYNNPIVLISENVREELLYRYESGEGEKHRGIENGKVYNEIKCFWISCNVGNIFNIQCQKGNLWTEEIKNQVPIPIVLGSDYLGIFEVGDIINGISPITENVQFEVFGILKEGEYLIHRGKIINLDRYVLIPLQDAKNLASTKEEERCQRILYLFKINGTLCSDLPANELQDLIQNICDTSGVCPSSTVTGATNMQSHIVNVNLQDILILLKKVVILLKVCSGIATILYFVIKIDKNKEYYSILILNGFSLKQIICILLGTLALLLVISETIAGFLFFLIAFIMWKAAEISFIKIFADNLIITLAITLVINIIGYMKLKKLDISVYIGGDEEKQN